MRKESCIIHFKKTEVHAWSFIRLKRDTRRSILGVGNGAKP
jgi:hypothetical protein